jgi:hypothetical protein
MFFSPKQATTSFRPHSYLNPLNIFRTTAAAVSSESPSPAEQSALRESNPDAFTPLHYRSPLFSRKTRYQTVANNDNNDNTDTTRVTTTNLGTNYRYVPTSATPPRVLRTNSKTKTKGHYHHHHRRHVNAGVRVQIQANNALRKERSFRIMERHRSIRSEDHDTSTSGVRGGSEFPTLAQKVKIAFASSEVPTTYEEQVFYQELEKLGLDYVKVATVMDPRRAEEVEAERENMLAMLENERMQFACVMKRKEEEKKGKDEKKKKKRVREREEHVRLDKDKRKAKEEIRRKKKARLSHEARMHTEKARLEEEERRSREQERLARLEAEKFVRLEEHRARVEEDTQARLREEQRRVAMEREAERLRLMRESAEAAKIAAEQRAMQEAHARQAAEQAARRAHVETQAHLQARMDEMARLQLEAQVQAMMDTRRRQEIEERFKEQEDRLRAHVFEYVRFQAAFESHSFQARRVVAEEEEAKARWYFSHAQQQNLNEKFNFYAEDILMRDPSYMASVNGDVSMSSIPDPLSDPTSAPLNHAPSPHPYIPPPQPNTLEEWFALYDSRWQEIRSLASSPPSSPDSCSKPSLTFAHFPWPVFRFITTLEDLDEKEINLFFTKKHPRKLDKAWKEDLRRWHTDKLGLFVSKIHPESVGEVEEGFLRCIRVMTVFQSEKGMGARTR